MTTATTFKQNTKQLKRHLVTWVTEIIDTQGIHAPHFPNPMLCFKGKQFKEESNGNDSYLSTCSTTYSYAEYSIDEMNSGPSTQLWSAPLLIPGTIEATTSTGVSALSRDEFDCVTNKNTRLSKEITKLKQQMALLLQNHKNNLPNNKMPKKCSTQHQQCILQQQVTKICSPQSLLH